MPPFADRFRAPDPGPLLRRCAVDDREPPPLSVLLCEDEDTVAALLTWILEKQFPPCRIVRVSDGNLALAVLARHPFDLLITDQQHLGLPGTALCRVAKALRPRLAVLMFAGFSEKELAQEARCWDLFVEKPADVPKIADAIRDVLLTVPDTKPWTPGRPTRG